MDRVITRGVNKAPKNPEFKPVDVEPFPHARVRALVKKWMDILRLDSWKINIEWVVYENANVFGEMSTLPYYEAKLRLFANLIPTWEVLTETVVHELIHLRFHRTLEPVYTLLNSDILSGEAKKLLASILESQTEYDVEELAQALIELAP